MIDIDEIERLNKNFSKLTPTDVLRFVAEKFKNKICFASSMGAEDQVITDLIAKAGLSIPIFTLDTGRLFEETYQLISATTKRYGINIEIYFPVAKEVQEMVNTKGINLFYDSLESRKLCCEIRKKHPLKNAFKGRVAWICGLRSEQAISRFATKLFEDDEANGLIKINPLVRWTEKQVWDYIKTNNVPYNKLHDKNFPSIGCACCTRAVNPGDDVRAGRWWWEEPEQKECGLHTKH